jgi:thiol-disulfide isomerase/thioredoxin
MSHSTDHLVHRGRWRGVAFAALGALGLAGAGAAFLLQPAGSPQARACEAGAAVSPAVARAATGELAAFQAFERPRPVPALAFQGPDGQPLTLASLSGKTVLLNLWATWCAPCRKEMPALDALQGAFGGPAFEVVAINIDTRNLERPRAWLAEHGINRLAYYADPEAKVFQDLKRAGQAVGMPTTLLIDAKGCALGVLHGPAEWASPDAKRLIQAALGR